MNTPEWEVQIEGNNVKKVNGNGTIEFVGPALSPSELAEVIATVQEQGFAAGIAKHFELADKHQPQE